MPKSGIGPFARLVFAELGRQRMRYQDAEEFSGVKVSPIKAWRHKSRLGLESLTAVLALLKFQPCPVPEHEALPLALAGELTALALKMRMNIPQMWTALIDIGVEQKLLRMRTDERGAVLAEHESCLTGIPAKATGSAEARRLNSDPNTLAAVSLFPILRPVTWCSSTSSNG